MVRLTGHTERGSTTRRAVWVVLDQAVSSLTNFGLSVLVLRSVLPDEFGAFTVALTVYVLALGVCRALGGEPQAVRCSHVDHDEWLEATRAATGLALLVGVASGGVLLVGALVVGGLVGAALVPLAAVLPGLMLQDAWRYAFFAAGSPSRAFVNDVVWGITQIGLTAWVLRLGSPGVARLVFAWGMSATVAALFGMAQARAVPKPTASLRWLSTQRDLAPRFAVEFLVNRASGQLLVLAVGAISGLDALAVLTAAAVLLGPSRVILFGAVGFAVPEGARIWRRDPERLKMVTVAFAAVLAVPALLCGFLAYLLPDRLGIELLGATWEEARPVLPWAAVWFAGWGAAEGCRVGLRVLAASRQSLSAQAQAAPVILVGGAAGAAWSDALGASIGLAISCWLAAALWWRHFVTADRVALAAIRSGHQVHDQPTSDVGHSSVDRVG